MLKDLTRWLPVLALPLLFVSSVRAQGDRESPPDMSEKGLVVHKAGVSPGYVLYSPLTDTSTYLLDNEGEVVHTWSSAFGPSGVYLMDDGSLLRCGRLLDPPFFHGGGIYGRLERIAPDGEVTWTYDLATDQRMIHHDVEPLPNGNVLFIAWERIEPRDALAKGRHPEALHREEGLWPDMVFEVRPTLPSGGEIVWEWHSWDHVVQDFDTRSEGYTPIALRPGRFDVNGDHRDEPALSPVELARLQERERQMRALGYVGGNDSNEDKDRRRRPDWMHTNAIDYHAEYDLIVLSSPEFSELYVIDHSTSTEQARGTSGGRWGQGGEILWRWGHPRRYAFGDDGDQALWYQHDPQWLDGSNAGAAVGGEGQAVAPGLRLTVYNNGGGRPGGDRSSVDELVLPFQPERGFTRAEGEPWGPTEPDWSYEEPEQFFSSFISGAQRLPNGNTLICQGKDGRVFEVTRAGEVVWEFRNPTVGDAPPPKGVGGGPALGFAVFRATRYAPDHPGIVALLEEPSPSQLVFDAQPGWTHETPSSSMRVAEFSLSEDDDGAGDASLVIYYFGQGGAQGIEANMARWIGQFEQTDGRDSQEVAVRTSETRAELTLTTLELGGTYVAETAPGSGVQLEEHGWYMLATIIETPAGSYYAKLIGPESTVRRWKESYAAFLATTRL
jgi:hypothetical protein